MTFGKNPYVAKAQAAELRAEGATDDLARTSALREAAHLWDRAAEREQPGKRREEYLANATRNRDAADTDAGDDEDGEGDGGGTALKRRVLH